MNKKEDSVANLTLRTISTDITLLTNGGDSSSLFISANDEQQQQQQQPQHQQNTNLKDKDDSINNIGSSFIDSSPKFSTNLNYDNKQTNNSNNFVDGYGDSNAAGVEQINETRKLNNVNRIIDGSVDYSLNSSFDDSNANLINFSKSNNNRRPNNSNSNDNTNKNNNYEETKQLLNTKQDDDDDDENNRVMKNNPINSSNDHLFEVNQNKSNSIKSNRNHQTLSKQNSKESSAQFDCNFLTKCNEKPLLPSGSTHIDTGNKTHSKLTHQILEYFADIRCFTFFMCLIVMLTNALTVGYRNSVVTTIEKRFEFSSVFSGVLSGCLEFGSLITTLLVSYFCSKSHIPRSIAVSSICCALGSLMYALPHLLSGSYTINNRVMNKTTEDLICRLKPSIGLIRSDLVGVAAAAAAASSFPNSFDSTSSIYFLTQQDTDSDQVQAKALFHKSAVISFLDRFEINPNCLIKPSNYGFFSLLILANVLIGCSSAPLYTLGTTYIDNHVTKDNSSIYLGFMYSMLAFGPVVGYLVGAGLLQFYVDGFHFSAAKLNINPGDSNWIGAWYVGFVLFGILIFFTAFPFLCFPKVIAKNRKQVEHENKYTIATNIESNESIESTFGDFKTLPKAIKNIIKNKVFMIVTIAFCFEITIISGFMTFLPKYIEHQFTVNDSMANIYTGGIAIPGACVGIVMGGFLVKRFKIDPKGASKMAITCNIFCTLGILVLIFLGCPNIKMAGTTVSYNSEIANSNPKISLPDSFNLTSTCNSECYCSSRFIEPICGINGLTYFSPCHAGCKKYSSNNVSSNSEDQQKKNNYSSCSCIINDLIQNSKLKKDTHTLEHAQSGICPSNCNTLAPFLIILFLITLLTALNQMPMLMVTLRSVSEIERPFALGLQLVILRLLAYIPSPLIFGRSIDWTCLVWRKDECDQTGSCLFYDREKFRHVYGTIAAIYKGISLLLFIFLYYSVRKYNFKQKPIDITTMMKSSVTSLNSIHKKHHNSNHNTTTTNNNNNSCNNHDSGSKDIEN